MKSLGVILLLLIGIVTYSQQLEKINLGENVNSEYHEINPVISPDGNVLYFNRFGHPENRYGTGETEDIWFSEKRADGSWSLAQRLPNNFNLIQKNFLATISPDGNVIMLRGAFEAGRYKSKGYSFTYRERGGWTRPERLDIRHYEDMDQGYFSGACLANNGNTIIMYFSEMPYDSINDLYYSKLTPKGHWTKPRKLPGNVNGKKTDEISPFLASDNRTLYFASNRPGGFGSKDIYMTKRIGDDWNQWTDPVNLGKPINSEDYEGAYTIDAKGKMVYMVTTTNSFGYNDIVTIALREEFQPDPVVLVEGRVLNSVDGNPLVAEILYERLSDGEIVGKASSDPTSGKYKIVLPYGENYGVTARINGYYPISENLDLRDTKEYVEVSRDLKLSPIEKGHTIRLNNVFFDFNKSELRSESFSELNRVLQLMNENPGLVIKITGHTDNVGDDKYNLKLSQERARAVRNYLLERGIDKERVSSQGWGRMRPVATNETEEGRQLNRRVEFTIVNK